MEVNQNLSMHRVNMTGRRSALITGVKDVRSFDEQEIVIEIAQELMTIHGSELHVGKLSLESGEVEITGHIEAVIYADDKGIKDKGKSFLSRLFT